MSNRPRTIAPRQGSAPALRSRSRYARDPRGESPRQPDTAKIGDRRMAADGSEIALVPVAEWRRLVLAKRGSPNHTRDVVPALLGGWRKTWHREVVLPRDSCSVADDKDFRIARQ